MKIRRIFAGLAAAAIAATMTVTASAKDLYAGDVPDNIGGMGFFMSRQSDPWQWNASDWVGLAEDGTITLEYSINEILADKTASGQGTLGEMGLMICNLPEEGYPYNMKVLEATFTPKGGDPIELKSVLDIKGGYKDYEADCRIRIRPDDTIKDGLIVTKATPEVAGMDQPGNFKGGVLKIKVSFKDAPEAPAQPAYEKAPEESGDGAKDDTVPAAGVAAGGSAAIILLAGTALVCTKRRK